MPQPQVDMHDAQGFIGRVDFYFADSRVVIECDGYAGHSNRKQWEQDIVRRNRLLALGLPVVQITWSSLLTRADETIGNLSRILQMRATADSPAPKLAASDE